MKKNTSTSGDVAKLANVSQSAVSRVYTEGASVSDATRKRVLTAADELGYRPNALARAVISGRSRLIAVMVAYLDNQFYPVVLEKLSRALQERGYQALLLMTEPGTQDKVVEQILEYQVEGILMASASLSSNLAIECANTGIPVVLFNRYVASLPVSSVTTDNIEGARLLADFLVRGGHRHIAYIAGYEDSSTNRDREAGFYKGLAEHGRTISARAVGGYSFEGAAEAASELFDRPDRPDAVFVANDHMAFSVMDVLRSRLGLKIPEDVSVVGFDDVPEASWKAYDLTTISQQADEMLNETLSILLEQIENRAINKRASVIPAKLVVRGSARLPE